MRDSWIGKALPPTPGQTGEQERFGWVGLVGGFHEVQAPPAPSLKQTQGGTHPVNSDTGPTRGRKERDSVEGR